MKEEWLNMNHLTFDIHYLTVSLISSLIIRYLENSSLKTEMKVSNTELHNHTSIRNLFVSCIT